MLKTAHVHDSAIYIVWLFKHNNTEYNSKQ